MKPFTTEVENLDAEARRDGSGIAVRMHHAARTVSDMDRALAFYRDLLGLEVVLDEMLEGKGFELTVGLEGAKARIVELAAGSQLPLLELLEYRSPAGISVDPRHCDIGAQHVCFEVGDIQDAHRRLVVAGVEFSNPPHEIPGGGFKGDWAAYCFDPDGMTVELWQSNP